MSKIINNRVNFASVKNPMPYPDFLEVQLKSFRDFLQLDTPPEKRKNDGLYKVFSENFPIADTRNNFVLEFLDYYIDAPRYTVEECLERGLTYSVPLKAKLKLYCSDPDHEDFDTVIQDAPLPPRRCRPLPRAERSLPPRTPWRSRGEGPTGARKTAPP